MASKRESTTMGRYDSYKTILAERRGRMASARGARDFEAASKFLEENETARAIKADDDKMWAAMNGTEYHSPHRPNCPNCLHARGAAHVNPLVKLCRDVVWRAFVCLVFVCLQLGAATPAEQLFHQAQKAERDGEIVKAYLLYSEAAAADPGGRSEHIRFAAPSPGPYPPDVAVQVNRPFP